MFRSLDPVDGNGEKITNNNENSLDPNVPHTETISYTQIQDDKYREATQKFISLQTPNFSNLNEVQKITYLSGLKHLGHFSQHSSFYPDKITELWKSSQLEEIMPKSIISDTDLENVIKTYVESEFNGRSSIPREKLEHWEEEHPFMCARDGLVQFGPMLPRGDGMRDSLGVAELGWMHMPETYSRLNIYSGLSEHSNTEEGKMTEFTRTVSHLYSDSLEQTNPLFAKFTTTRTPIGNEVRLCSYVNDDLLVWQLKSLSEYFNEPISIQTIVQDGENAEIRLFSEGKIGLRSSNEAGLGIPETGRLLKLINEMKSKG